MTTVMWVFAGFFFPRLTLLFLWSWTDLVENLFHGLFFPLVGLCLAPYTTLTYMAAATYSGGVTGWWVILCSWAILVDVYHFETTSAKVKNFSGDGR